MNNNEALELVRLDLDLLINMADKVRSDSGIKKIDLCSIMNAKSGMCSEDCKFCAQSSYYSTNAPIYPLKRTDEIIRAAERAKSIGADRFDIVTSGNELTGDDLSAINNAIKTITEDLGMKMCASLGKLSIDQLLELRGNGLTRYHHNLETSESYYPNIVSTHSYKERVSTVRAIKKAGLEACSGGIIGLGESWQDRIDMAMLLKELNVDSVPLNILVPVKGTPFEGKSFITQEDALRTIAIFRIILGDKIIKVAAGRESFLRDKQEMAFRAGASGMLIGGYLTTAGGSVESDREMVARIESSWSEN